MSLNPLARILQVLNIVNSPPPVRRSRFIDNVEVAGSGNDAPEEGPSIVRCALCHEPIPEGDEERCVVCGQVFCPDCFEDHECPTQEEQQV